MSIWNLFNATAIKEAATPVGQSVATAFNAIFLGTNYAPVEPIANPGFWATVTGWGASLLSTAYSYIPNVMNYIPSYSVVSSLPSIAMSTAQSNPYATAGIAVSPAMLDAAKMAANKLGYGNLAAYIPAPMTASVNGTVAATKATANGVVTAGKATANGLVTAGQGTANLLRKTPSLLQYFRRGSDLRKGIDQVLDGIIDRAIPNMGPEGKKSLISAINVFFGGVFPEDMEMLVRNPEFRDFICDKDATGRVDAQNRLAAVQRFLPEVQLLPEIAAEFRKVQAVYDVVSQLPAETLALFNSAGVQGGVRLAKAFVASKDTNQKGRTLLAVAQDHSEASQAQLQGLIRKMATANKIELSAPSNALKP